MSAPPRLIDLSVAVTADAAAALERSVGTDSYMAPEQCDPVALGPVGAAADIWGLGATLYRAATGERPFPNGDPKASDPLERWPQLDHDPEPGPLPAVIAEPSSHACRRARTAAAPGGARRGLEPVLRAQPKPRLSGLRPRWR